MASESAAKADVDSEENSKPEEPAKKEMKHGKDDFELGQLLGGGSYAKVVEGTIINEKSPQFGRKYAVKVMDKRHIMKNNKIKYVSIEKQVFLATAPHPFICHLHFTFQDSYSLFMVLDLCGDAELSYQIWKYCGLSEELTRFYMSEVVSCLQFMHSKGIYHRDIKPENILLHSDGHIRLTDFGTSKIEEASHKKASENDADEAEQKTEAQRKGSFVGTAQYVPPELLDKDSEVSWAGMDFWALGILIYQCLLNKTPFFAPNEYLTFKKIEEHSYEVPDTLSEPAKSVIDAFLSKQLKDRLGMNGFDDIKQHKFFEPVPSWEWEEMIKVEPPKYPPTPAHSPVHDEDEEKNRKKSVYDGIGDEQDKVVPISLDDVNEETAKSKPKPSSLEKQDSSMEMKAALHSKWKQFLQKEEEIEMGGTVEKSKYFGMGSERSVMLLTTQRRVLLIDTDKNVIRKNGEIARSSIVDVAVLDKDTFELRFVKNKMKFKCIGQKAEKWQKAFEKIC
eukprot:CAMPEP_0197032342 /NCGR_PEP_ID=MMETSP1384-20130603/11030_1 /TAXON_ID=29189 /ORGANISM="Ammonia sp." /LENGTH=505 /DNA_ID=CAMNT_0042461987 /DNA_START=77 /DNA_END=1594 /DNA_ORIENTATION=+